MCILCVGVCVCVCVSVSVCMCVFVFVSERECVFACVYGLVTVARVCARARFALSDK